MGDAYKRCARVTCDIDDANKTHVGVCPVGKQKVKLCLIKTLVSSSCYILRRD